MEYLNNYENMKLQTQPQCNDTFKSVADAVRFLNEAVQKAVDSGLSVEVIRTSRHHNGCGNWGDQLVTKIDRTAASNIE